MRSWIALALWVVPACGSSEDASGQNDTPPVSTSATPATTAPPAPTSTTADEAPVDTTEPATPTTVAASEPLESAVVPGAELVGRWAHYDVVPTRTTL